MATASPNVVTFFANLIRVLPIFPGIALGESLYRVVRPLLPRTRESRPPVDTSSRFHWDIGRARWHEEYSLPGRFPRYTLH